MKITKFKAHIPLGDEKKKYFVDVVFLHGWGLFGQKKVYSPDLIDLLSFDIDPAYLEQHPEKRLNKNSFFQIIEDNEDLWQICND
jgi:hypothetical protein